MKTRKQLFVTTRFPEKTTSVECFHQPKSNSFSGSFNPFALPFNHEVKMWFLRLTFFSNSCSGKNLKLCLLN